MMMFPLDAGRGASAPPSTRSRGDCNFLQNKPFTNPSRPIPVVTLDIALSKHDRSTQVCINLGFQMFGYQIERRFSVASAFNRS